VSGRILSGKPFCRLIGLCALLALVGCGKGEGDLANLVPVAGTVAVGDKPLTTGSVTFRPDAARGNLTKHEPHGRIGSDGKYEMLTTTLKGVPPGWYKVRVTATMSNDPKNPYAIPTSLIPTRYADPETSGLSLEVVEKPEAGRYDLPLQPE
jgi:hypothetical protein